MIASHVIEHVPNPLGWFRGIAEVLAKDGVFNLAIPDKRFTFDAAAPLSSAGDLIEAYVMGFDRPSPRQVFNACYYVKAITPGAIWSEDSDVQSAPSYSGDVTAQLSYDQSVRSTAGIYFDSHCWIVTPYSFLELIEAACKVDLFDYLLDDYHLTLEGEFEFFLNLRKPREGMSRADLRIHQLQRIEFFRIVIRERDRKLKLMAE